MLCSTSKHLIRQQTFPPLNPYVRTRYMSSTADLGTCPEALLESRSSSSTDSPDNENSNALSKKRETEHSFEKTTKWAKLSIGPNQKENLDPAGLRKGSTNRRRGSAPISVALPSKSSSSVVEQDAHMSSLQVKTSEKVRRCSVPAETITLSECGKFH